MTPDLGWYIVWALLHIHTLLKELGNNWWFNALWIFFFFRSLWVLCQRMQALRFPPYHFEIHPLNRVIHYSFNKMVGGCDLCCRYVILEMPEEGWLLVLWWMGIWVRWLGHLRRKDSMNMIRRQHLPALVWVRQSCVCSSIWVGSARCGASGTACMVVQGRDAQTSALLELYTDEDEDEDEDGDEAALLKLLRCCSYLYGGV